MWRSRLKWHGPSGIRIDPKTDIRALGWVYLSSPFHLDRRGVLRWVVEGCLLRVHHSLAFKACQLRDTCINITAGEYYLRSVVWWCRQPEQMCDAIKKNRTYGLWYFCLAFSITVISDRLRKYQSRSHNSLWEQFSGKIIPIFVESAIYQYIVIACEKRGIESQRRYVSDAAAKFNSLLHSRQFSKKSSLYSVVWASTIYLRK